MSQGTYLARAVPFWDASCATFFHGAPKLRELRRGNAGLDAGVLTAAVHDEVSRSRFLERRTSSRSAREERSPVFPCLAANGNGEKKREDAAS